MHELIAGGAGTGKTTELVKRSKSEQNALFLSRRGTTVYKLALDIVTSVEGVVPEPERIAAEVEKKSCFSSKKEYDDRLTYGMPISLCGEEMKSYGEIEIANFLFESKIDYIYEAPYEKDTRTSDHAQYRPDFYLPDYGIYIEYFALDREGRAPEYFGDGGEYARSAEWKKALHREKGTELIDLYAYERAEGTLIRTLTERLKAKKVKLRRRRKGEIYPKKAAACAHIGADFEPIVKKAAEYAASGAYVCPYTRIFADDIDLMSSSCIELLYSLSVPITASARSADAAPRGTALTRLEKSYRTPSYKFAFSHTEKGITDDIIRYIRSLPEESRILVIGKKSSDVRLLVRDGVTLSYDRRGEYVRIALAGGRGAVYCTASRAEGWSCDHAVVLSDSFDTGDERELETALTRASGSVLSVSKVGAETEPARAFRVSLGVDAPKKGFTCPKCGSPLTVVKGRYGDFLGCSNYKGGCNYKIRM